MKIKRGLDWKVENGHLVECIVEGCRSRPDFGGYCTSHYLIVRKESDLQEQMFQEE